jgi:hypothetical protein
MVRNQQVGGSIPLAGSSDFPFPSKIGRNLGPGGAWHVASSGLKPPHFR